MCNFVDMHIPNITILTIFKRTKVHTNKQNNKSNKITSIIIVIHIENPCPYTTRDLNNS